MQDAAFLDHDHSASSKADEHSAEAEVNCLAILYVQCSLNDVRKESLQIDSQSYVTEADISFS